MVERTDGPGTRQPGSALVLRLVGFLCVFDLQGAHTNTHPPDLTIASISTTTTTTTFFSHVAAAVSAAPCCTHPPRPLQCCCMLASLLLHCFDRRAQHTDEGAAHRPLF